MHLSTRVGEYWLGSISDWVDEKCLLYASQGGKTGSKKFVQLGIVL